MRKILLGVAATPAMAAPLTLAATPAQAAGDGHGNTFNVRESQVNVIGDWCASIYYSVDGWAAGWEANYAHGYAFATVSGAGMFESEMFDWWSQTDWDNLTWSGEKRVCRKIDSTITIRGEFDVDYGYDRYHTAIKETVSVNYHPVSLTATNHPNNLVVKVRKDGKSWGHVRVSVTGHAARTNGKGVVKFAKRALPKGKVKVKVDTSPRHPGRAYATARVRVELSTPPQPLRA